MEVLEITNLIKNTSWVAPVGFGIIFLRELVTCNPSQGQKKLTRIKAKPESNGRPTVPSGWKLIKVGENIDKGDLVLRQRQGMFNSIYEWHEYVGEENQICLTKGQWKDAITRIEKAASKQQVTLN